MTMKGNHQQYRKCFKIGKDWTGKNKQQPSTLPYNYCPRILESYVCV